MCELLALSMRCPTRVTASLAGLAARSDKPGRARDGWGFAAYQGADVALFREARPASDSALARMLASEGPVTGLALAHIRRATLGEVTLANTQPFVREAGGVAHVFAHNGHLPGLSRSSLHGRFTPIGDTDSEIAFCALLERLQVGAMPDEDGREIARRAAIVADFAADLRRHGPANFLYADGHALYVHADRRMHEGSAIPAPPGLHLLERRCDGLQASDLCIAPGGQQAAVVASVPLSAEPWQALGEGDVLAIAGGEVLHRLRP
ncbi:MAG: class II glutamine amidotransferase [Ideonella sp.]|nr:class II glutamine amidotransferase [Ideonella sp.]MCC7459514.1 class II glutamine amidotransferase [Nitrospira sp.]